MVEGPLRKGKTEYALLLLGPVLSGLFGYLVLSAILVPPRLTVPSSVILATLIFGLSVYYYRNGLGSECNELTSSKMVHEDFGDSKTSTYPENKKYRSISVLFISVYSILLLTIGFLSTPNSDIFLPWEQVSSVGWFQLIAAMLLAFFLPGYALVNIVNSNSGLKLLPRLLLSYIFSILITGFTGYIMGITGFGSLETKTVLLIIYLIVLFLFSASVWFKIYRKKNSKISADDRLLEKRSEVKDDNKYLVLVKNNFPKVIVFGSLLALVLLFTYLLYGGVIIGDQWVHHGRALLFMSGSFRDALILDEDLEYPSFFPAMLASYFTLTGIPSVNAYVSINFLNIMPVFAFYYFFVKWSSAYRARAALFASALFMVSAGFGWIYVVDIAASENGLSVGSMLNNLDEGRIRTFDIFQPSTFVGVDHPGITSPLIIVGLPAGLILLGMLREYAKEESVLGHAGYAIIIFVVSLVGILAHGEFFFFIIVASFLILIFRVRRMNIVFVSFIIAILFPTFLQIVGLQTEYSINNDEIYYGLPLVLIMLGFLAIMWVLSTVRYRLTTKTDIRKRLWNLSSKRVKRTISIRNFLGGKKQVRLALAISLVSLVSYLYIFTFLVWKDLSLEEVQIQTTTLGQRDIPWYLYPMKLGIAGLLGIAFLLSYLFKRFEREIFVFGIIAIIALFVGPYYDEHRFSKYIMIGMSSFASLLIYSIVTRIGKSLKPNVARPMIMSVILGITITVSGLSVFMYVGYAAMAMENDFEPYKLDLPKREFPSLQEIEMMRFIYNQEDNGSGTAAMAIDQYDIDREGLAGKVHAFSGIPYYRIMQGKTVLGSSTIEGLYDLLNSTNTDYIILPKKEITDLSGHNKNEAEKNVESLRIAGPVRFAINNFETIYQNSDYIVLSVPHNLVPPSSGGNLAFISYVDTPSNLPSQPLAKYLLLSYPLLGAPDSNISRLFYNDNGSFSNMDSQKRYVDIQKDEFALNGNEYPNSVIVPSISNHATLYNKTGETTLWSNQIRNDSDINYINNRLKISNAEKKENGSSEDVAGIVWVDRYGDSESEYYAFLSSGALQLKITDINERQDVQELRFQNKNIMLEKGVLYSIKVILSENTIYIYVNDVLGLEVPRISSSTSSNSNRDLSGDNNGNPMVSRIGIRSDKTNATFGPLEFGHITLPTHLVADYGNTPRREYNTYYYPISMLAMDGHSEGYEVYANSDLSAFSKDSIMLPMDPVERISESPDYSKTGVNNSEALTQNDGIFYNTSSNRYLEFVKGGGTLIVLDSHNDTHNDGFNGEFSQLLSIQPGNTTKFDAIGFIGSKNNSEMESESLEKNVHPVILGSGITRNISSTSPDTKILSYYIKDNKPVAPFAFEKAYNNTDGVEKGKIIYVNIAGYFDSNMESQGDNFHTIGNVMSLVDTEKGEQIQAGKLNNSESGTFAATKTTARTHADSHELDSKQIFTGYLQTNGKTKIDSSSMSLFSDIKNLSPYLEADSIYFSDQKNNESSSFSNVTIKNIVLKGKYGATIYTSGNVSIPSSPPHYDYIPISLPPGFDMRIRLTDEANGRLILENSTLSTVDVPVGGKDIYIQGIKTGLNDTGNMEILVKDPELESIGTTSLNGSDSAIKPQPYGNGIKIQGNFSTRIDNADLYYLRDQNGFYEMNYASRANAVDTDAEDENIDTKNSKIFNVLEFPGDISDHARELQVSIPWQKVLGSKDNYLTIVVIMITTVIIGVWYIRRKMV